jgi:hypothetical protein
MAVFDMPKNTTPEAAVAYLNAEKAKIEKNRDDIRNAIEQGKRLLPAQ